MQAKAEVGTVKPLGGGDFIEAFHKFAGAAFYNSVSGGASGIAASVVNRLLSM